MTSTPSQSTNILQKRSSTRKKERNSRSVRPSLFAGPFQITLTCAVRDTVKEKYGSDYSEAGDSDADDFEDSEDTEEDSDGEELTPAVDAAILRTLALIKKKDPAIYEGERRVFEGVFGFVWSSIFGAAHGLGIRGVQLTSPG